MSIFFGLVGRSRNRESFMLIFFWWYLRFFLSLLWEQILNFFMIMFFFCIFNKFIKVLVIATQLHRLLIFQSLRITAINSIFLFEWCVIQCKYFEMSGYRCASKRWKLLLTLHFVKWNIRWLLIKKKIFLYLYI